MTHLTTVRSNGFTAATMLAQVALVRDYGPAVALAPLLIDCAHCDWRSVATSHADQITQRLEHERWAPS